MTSLADAVARGDLDELIRLVDGLCSAREWDRLVELRDRCRHALERGLQLWPAAEYAEYRLALDAPGSHAGPVITHTAGRFSMGPLWEVAASTHTWSDLTDHIPAGPARAMAAHERVIRGDDVPGDEVDPHVLELPLRVERWEPAYDVAVYRSSESDFPSPTLPDLQRLETSAGDAVEDDDAIEALLDLTKPWVEQSNGAAAAVAVEGDAAAAIGVFGHDAVRAAQVSGADAMAFMAWWGASGGAYGRRRGTPAGRFGAWWTVAAVGGMDPPEADDGEGLAAVLDELEWWVWEPPGVTGGWQAHLAVADPEHGLAWALSASDSLREDDPLAEG